MTNAQPVQPSTSEDHALLHNLRVRRRARRPKPVSPPAPTLGQRLADSVAATVGSWPFIIMQSGLIVAWIGGNAIVGPTAWDPFPFILLNLLLSFQAAYTAPAIMMSQNRQAAIDRAHAETDYEINVKAELEIELLHQKVDLMREQEIVRLLGVLERLEARLAALPDRAGPSPTGGYVFFVPRREVIPLSMSVEDGLKMVVSMGIVAPPVEQQPLPARRRIA